MITPASSLTPPSALETPSPSAADLFALTDEQILDIQPDAPVAQPLLAVHDVSNSPDHPGQAISEPPPWLADLMNDPQAGSEARDLWNGVQQSRSEAAAYREVFSKPEEARAAAERAHSLEEIDAAFFGGAGKSPQEISIGRAALAQRMLREDPAAFREMVFAGLRALEEVNVAPPFRAASAPVDAPAASYNAAQDAQLAAYRTFEKSANDELERSVGTAIQRSLEQALPVAQTILSAPSGTASPAQARLPALQQRLAAAVRDNVESALKSDTQLGEQLARVLSARLFDEATRSQVVRLINDRAQQLVPVATRRIIQDWTQTTFAAHRPGTVVGPGGPAPFAGTSARTAEGNSASGASTPSRAANSHAPAPAISAKAAAANRAQESLTHRTAAPPHGRAVDYARLSDEQILDL